MTGHNKAIDTVPQLLAPWWPATCTRAAPWQGHDSRPMEEVRGCPHMTHGIRPAALDLWLALSQGPHSVLFQSPICGMHLPSALVHNQRSQRACGFLPVELMHPRPLPSPPCTHLVISLVLWVPFHGMGAPSTLAKYPRMYPLNLQGPWISAHRAHASSIPT